MVTTATPPAMQVQQSSPHGKAGFDIPAGRAVGAPTAAIASSWADSAVGAPTAVMAGSRANSLAFGSAAVANGSGSTK